jgi:hypothetical protein
MAPEPKTYRRLTRNASGIAGYTSLWAASDHLLMVFSTGYNESYSRIEFRDVKAFILTESSRRLRFAVVYGIVAFIGATFAGVELLDHSTFYAGAIVLALGLIGLAINASLGPTTLAYVVTGVQMTKIPALRRRRQARQVLYGLETLIREAQAGDGAASAPPIPP